MIDAFERIAHFVKQEYRAFRADAARPVLVAGQQADEAGLIERASTGSAARHFLESTVVQDFMAGAEANLTHAMLSLPLDDHEGRRNLACAVNATRQTWKYLLALAGDGRGAERELERLRKGSAPY